MSEEPRRLSGAERKALQREKAKEKKESVQARAGRATTDAAGALESGISEAKSRVEERKEAPRGPRTVGPIEQRARDISIRTLGGIYGKRVKGTRPEDVFPDLKGKGTMSGDAAAGIDIMVGMHREISNMMRRSFEPSRGADPYFEEAPELDDKARRHINLAKDKTQVTPTAPQSRPRKFSRVRSNFVDPKEIPSQAQRPSVSPEISQKMQQARQLSAQDFARQRSADQFRTQQTAALAGNISLRDVKATSPIQPSGWAAQRQSLSRSVPVDFGPYANDPSISTVQSSRRTGPNLSTIKSMAGVNLRMSRPEKQEIPKFVPKPINDYAPGSISAELRASNEVRYANLMSRFDEIDKKASGS
jgi:hypothetical protein